MVYLPPPLAVVSAEAKVLRIPDHLVHVVQELAEAYLKRVAGDLPGIEFHLGSRHPNALEARARLTEAQELVAHVGRPTRAAA